MNPEPMTPHHPPTPSTTMAAVVVLRGTIVRDPSLLGGREVARGTWTYDEALFCPPAPADHDDPVRMSAWSVAADDGGGRRSRRKEDGQDSSSPPPGPGRGEAFELIRNISNARRGGSEEEGAAGVSSSSSPPPLPLRGGTYHGSFVSDGQRVRENNVRLDFRPIRPGEEGGAATAAATSDRWGRRHGRYEVSGSGANKFGPFRIEGTASSLMVAVDPDERASTQTPPTYEMVLRKSYCCGTDLAAPSGESRGQQGGGGGGTSSHVHVTRQRTGKLPKRSLSFGGGEEEDEEEEGGREERRRDDEARGRAVRGSKRGAYSGDDGGGAAVSRDEFEVLLGTASEMRRTMNELLVAVASKRLRVLPGKEVLCGGGTAERAGGAMRVPPSRQGEGSATAAVPSRKGAPKASKMGNEAPKLPPKRRETKKKKPRRRRSAASSSPPPLTEEEPLTPSEKRDVVAALCNVRSDVELRTAARIILRCADGSAAMLDNDGEIELDIDVLDAATQRRLQRFLKLKKSPRRRSRKLLTAKGPPRRKPGRNNHRASFPSPSPSSAPPRQVVRSSGRRDAPCAMGSESMPPLGHFLNEAAREGDGAACASSEVCKGEPTKPSPEAEIEAGAADPPDGTASSVGSFSLPETRETSAGTAACAEEDASMAVVGAWSDFQAEPKLPARETSGGSWGLDAWSDAKREAAAVQSRDSERAARRERLRTDAVLARRNQMAESLAARARWREEVEAEESRRLREGRARAEAARRAVEAQIASTARTVYLDPIAIPEELGRFPYDSLSGSSACASPLSDVCF